MFEFEFDFGHGEEFDLLRDTVKNFAQDRIAPRAAAPSTHVAAWRCPCMRAAWVQHAQPARARCRVRDAAELGVRPPGCVFRSAFRSPIIIIVVVVLSLLPLFFCSSRAPREARPGMRGWWRGLPSSATYWTSD